MRTIEAISEVRIRGQRHGTVRAALCPDRWEAQSAVHRQKGGRRAADGRWRLRSRGVGALLLLGIAFGIAAGISGCRADSPENSTHAGAKPSAGADSEVRTRAFLEDHPVLSPNAKIETHELLLLEKANPPGPGDGGGRATWLRVSAASEDGFRTVWEPGAEPGSVPTLPVSSSARFEMLYEAGPLGIEPGGLLFIEPDPFWEWSPAQTRDPRGPGYVTATARASEIVLEPDGGAGRFVLSGRALRPGEQIEIVYGAGSAGAQVDRYQERGAQILIGVDATGDGTRAWLESLPTLDTEAREGVLLIATAPAELRPGETAELKLALVDAQGNAAHWPADASVTLETIPADDAPAAERLPAPAGSISGQRLRLAVGSEPGTRRYRVLGRGAIEGLTAEVNPIVVRDGARRLYWADLHGHSQHSDGTGRAADYFRYAREIGGLSAVALTDHDHWGVRPLDAAPDVASSLTQTAQRFNDPGRFVTLPGYEWTSWLHGHRHVLYFSEEDAEGHVEAPIYSAIDPATDDPAELWEALRGQPALTFSHHSAGEPVATNWSFRPDPELETIAEITSVHGMSEAHDAPLPILGGLAGLFVRDTLMRGARLGFIGSGDSHDGHPGLTQIAGGKGRGGLAGLFAEELSRGALLETLRARRTFATNGIRPWLSVHLDDVFMGGELAVADPATHPQRKDHLLRIRYEATAPVERIELIRSGVVASLPGGGELSIDLERRVPALRPGEFHYVRIIEQGRGVAWSSPVFATGPASGSEAPDL